MSDAVGPSVETAWLWLVRPIGPTASALCHDGSEVRGGWSIGLLPAPTSATLPTRPLALLGESEIGSA